MKIHLTGTIWHAGISTNLGHGFEELGHEVKFFNEVGPRNLNLMKKIGMRLVRWPYRVEDKFREKLGKLWIESIREYDPDLIVIVFSPNILPEDIQRAREFKKPIVYWVESPPDSHHSKELILGMQYVDNIFTIDPQFVPFLEKFSFGKEIGYLALAGDNRVFKPLILDPEERERRALYDISFVGSFSPNDASASWRGSLLNSIPEKYNLAVFGTGIPYWSKRFPRLAKAAQGLGTLPAEKINEIYNQSKIALNIHSTSHWTGVSARTFEIALAGEFQAVDFRQELDRLFPDNMLVNFKKREEMMPLIEEWIAKPKARWDNAEKVRRVVLEKHTWKNRAATILANLAM